MKYIVRACVLPFLLIGYLFYFLFRRIWVILSIKIRETEEWESKFIIVFFGVILFMLLYIGPVVCLLVLLHEWVLILLAAVTVGIGLPQVLIAALDDPDDDNSWRLSEIFDLMIDRNSLIKKTVSLRKDPDYEMALNELEKEFPGNNNEE